jgi:tetratricopeptide (TPR) repeat protein
MYKLSISQQKNQTPYLFKATGICVFSFEEVLYHIYHYWKQSVDDFLSDELITWVNDVLSLSYLAARMKELKRIDSFSQRMLSFLRLGNYFDDREVKSLSEALSHWEKRFEWEKLKERADDLTQRGEPDKAISLYHRALQYDENIQILNNLGVAHMQLGAYADAYTYLNRALMLDKMATPKLVLHYAEAAAYNQLYEEAEQALAMVIGEWGGICSYQSDAAYIRGILAEARRLWADAITHYEQAITLSEGGVPLYVYKLADVYVRMRQFEKAFSALERVAQKDVGYYIKQAEINASAGNVSAAVRCMQQAAHLRSSDADLFTKTAMYRRMDYDLTMADATIKKALAIAPDHERARLESARIKKALSRTKDYQTILNQMLKGFKQRYREVYHGRSV